MFNMSAIFGQVNAEK